MRISIQHWSSIFKNNGSVLNQTFRKLLEAREKSIHWGNQITVLGDAVIWYLEEGARVEGSKLEH